MRGYSEWFIAGYRFMSERNRWRIDLRVRDKIARMLTGVSPVISLMSLELYPDMELNISMV